MRGNCNDWIPSVFPLTSRRLMPKPFRLAISLERNATYARLFFYFYPSCQKTWKAIAQVRRVKEGHFQRPPKKRQNAAYSECDDFPINYKWCLNSIIIDLHRGRPEKKSLVKSKEKVGVMALDWPKMTSLFPIWIHTCMVGPMGTQSTHTKFGAPRPHQFFGAGPQSFTT